MKKVVVFSPDAVPIGGATAAGPGIRYFEIASGLHRAGLVVTLAVPAASFVSGHADFNVVPWTLDNFTEIVKGNDLVVLPQVDSSLSSRYPLEVPEDMPTSVDLYDPVLIENLGLQPRSDSGVRDYAGYLAGIIPILRRGDYFFCANKRQYHYYLGVLSALGRINPLTYNENLLEIVPFGVPAEPPLKTKTVMRGTIVGDTDPVILWFSGIYPWFDALTLVKAMPEVIKALPGAKLVVLGGVHPRGHAPDNEYRATVAEAASLRLTDKSVFFVDEWCPYPERVNWYLEADVAVTTHKRTLETELSHRTRVIDFLWAGLPAIVSSGDEVGAMLEAHGAGKAVPIGDAGALADELIRILGDEAVRTKMSKAARDLASDLTWDNVLAPLIEWAKAPEVAADRGDQTARETVLKVVATEEEHRRLSGQAGEGLLARARRVYQSEGFTAALRRTVAYGGRKVKGG